MSSSPESGGADPEAAATPLVTYDPEAFAEVLADLMADEEERVGTRLLFHGGVREQRQQALGTLTRYATGNVHQFQVPSLLSNQRMQTQNNLRKAFDHAAEERALLYFDKADPLFSHSHEDAPDSPEQAVPSTLEYFFDRVGAYAGMVVLGLQRQSHAEWARDKVHLVVRFDE
jgi:SpoVK/Ycf46/Vps4 family AAA+-type ATPase